MLSYDVLIETKQDTVGLGEQALSWNTPASQLIRNEHEDKHSTFWAHILPLQQTHTSVAEKYGKKTKRLSLGLRTQIDILCTRQLNNANTFLQTLAGSGQLVQLDVDVRHQEPCNQAVWSSLQAFNMITRDSCTLNNRLDVATWSWRNRYLNQSC